MTAYYNENDPKVAAWLRELIARKHIAPGEVDERSIVDVQPDDLRGFTQCHFFAGIGVWSYALRLAGWSDDDRVWTGSCPCQSFSASGKGGGFSDPRHLWPAWFRLIRESDVDCVFGEQTSSPAGLAWLDVVSSDLEGAGYAIGAADICAAGVGAPHIRSRLYFCADTKGRNGRLPILERRPLAQSVESFWSREVGIASDTNVRGPQAGRSGFATANGQRATDELRPASPEHCNTGISTDSANARRNDAREYDGGSSPLPTRPTERCGAGDRGHAIGARLEGHAGDGDERDRFRWLTPEQARSAAASGATRGAWADAEWWVGSDNKARPIGAGIFPLVNGAPARVVRLRGYGNAIVAPLAQAFIEAYREVRSAA